MGETATIAAAADRVAERLKDFAYGRECLPSHQESVLHTASGWELFAEELRRPAPSTEADR